MMTKKLALAVGVLLTAVTTLARADMVEHLERKTIAGVDVLVYQTAVKDVVTLFGVLPAGEALALANGEKVAVAKLTAMMLDRGTLHESKFAIAEKLQSVGASVSFRTESQSVQLQARCLSKDLPMVLQLIGEQLRAPALAQSELVKARQQLIGEMDRASDSVGYRSSEALNRLIFPAGDPNREPTIEEYKQGAAAITVAQLKAFHRKYYGPEHLTLVLVGDVHMPAVEAPVASVFKGWTGGVPYLRERASAAPGGISQTKSASVEIPGKTTTMLRVGQATGLRARDPDAVALEVGTAVLGSGFTGRLMHSVRVVEGLTYGIGADTSDDLFTAGSWQISGTFAPELLGRGVTSTQRELNHWWKDGVTEEELAARKTNLIGQYQVSLSDTEGMAYTILEAVLRGNDVGWLDEYPRAISAVSLSRVNAAIRQYLDPEKMVVVRAGTLPKT